MHLQRHLRDSGIWVRWVQEADDSEITARYVCVRVPEKRLVERVEELEASYRPAGAGCPDHRSSEINGKEEAGASSLAGSDVTVG